MTMVTLAPADQQTLNDQSIDGDQPGTVLRDFETVLAFIDNHITTVSPKHNLLSMGFLAPLNDQMTHPMQIALKRPQQRAYAHLHALYLLLRATGLAYVTGAENKPRLALDADGLASWRPLNSTERYFTLLETWLLRAKSEIIGERPNPFQSPIADWDGFFRRISDQGLRITGDKKEEERLAYVPGLLTVAMLELFGLVTVQHGKPEPGKGWRIVEIHRHPWGDALLHLLSEQLQSLDFRPRLDTEAEIEFGELQGFIQPYFPAWRHNLRLSEAEFRDGTHIFNVSLGRVWRRIAVQGRHDLDHLSDAILDAFEFDDDHLYKFSYTSRFGTLTSIHHPSLEESPLTSEVCVGEVPLRLGTSMTYLYDFGDRWEFDVRLERIDPVDRAMRKARILETHGKAPEQYPWANDWEA
jgi:hypothetical protein